MTCEGAVPSVSSQPGTGVPLAPKPAFPGATNAIHSALPTEDTDYPYISSDIQQVKLAKCWWNSESCFSISGQII